ncbi:hypothetical protein [Bacillus chungangensis]|uniref:Uncharacterized protein n=1 Tax=Bacillus chungangensis TaxID=587633 RepID=A0ABT9WMB0_9BACI|nr:hypothetical protein [Bacillus chungangensis]MDQ0174433.1 hypothetical protein [Bacillus chungangensis]
MKITQEQINELFFEGEIEVNGAKYKTVEEGDFEQGVKYQTAHLIFTDGKKHYLSYVTRSGSPFTDWEYEDWNDAAVYEVEQREVVVKEWAVVKSKGDGEE